MNDVCCSAGCCVPPSEGNNSKKEYEMLEYHGLSGEYTDELSPVRIGKSVHRDRVAFHKHKFYEMVLIDNGFSMHICDGVTTILTGGDLFLVSPGEPHSYINLHQVQIYNILFFDSFLGEDIERFRKLPGMEHVFGAEKSGFEKLHLSLREKQEIIVLLEKVITETENKQPGWDLKVKSLMMDFLVTYARISAGKKKSGQESSANFTQVSNALQYIEKNYAADISVKAIAKAAGISPDYMSKQFKSIVGIGPAEYCRNFRMAKAMELLKTTELSIADIARDLGFDEVSVFSRQFKQIVGVSPTAFRAG